MLHGKIVRSTCAHGVIQRLDVSGGGGEPGRRGRARRQRPARRADRVALRPGDPRPAAARDRPRALQRRAGGGRYRRGRGRGGRRLRARGRRVRGPARARDSRGGDGARRARHPRRDPAARAHAVSRHRAPPRAPARTSATTSGCATATSTAGFAESDEIFEDVFRTPAQQHCNLEPHVAVVSIEPDQATVWTSAASPYTVRFQVAETLRLPESAVRVVVSNVGGAYGSEDVPAAGAARRRHVVAGGREAGPRRAHAHRGVLHDHPPRGHGRSCGPGCAATARSSRARRGSSGAPVPTRTSARG